MARIAIFFGIVLVVLGIGLYAMSHPDKKSLTAFIPSAFGAVLVVIGLVAQSGSAKVRMHSMHAAALVGLIGLAMPAYRVIDKLSQGAEIDLAIGGSIAMAVLCGIFLALCVKSFIDIRRARKQAQITAD